jgi:hypothetical protein
VSNAIADAERLTAWIEPNQMVLVDPRTGNLVRDALARPVDPALAFGVPLMHFADGRPAITLIEALMTHPGALTLWVPYGASVVEVTVSAAERKRLDALTGNALRWF